MQSSGLEIMLDFSFKTKMDDFQIASVSLSGNIGKSPGKEGSGIEGIGKQFEEFGRKFYEEKILSAPKNQLAQ